MVATTAQAGLVEDDEPEPVVITAAAGETAPAAGNPKFIVPVGDVTGVGHRIFTLYYAP